MSLHAQTEVVSFIGPLYLRVLVVVINETTSERAGADHSNQGKFREVLKFPKDTLWVGL